VTKPEHRPRAHREWGEWPPERLVAWAQTRGPRTGEVAAAILARGPHADSGRRACLGLVRLGERHGSERLEAACGRALAIGNPTYKSVNAILKNGLENAGLVEEVEPERISHENIRGGEYFNREEVEQASADDEIESRYLDEERLAIINEPGFRSDRQAPGSGRIDKGLEASNQVTVTAPRFVATEPLAALLGRLQEMWTKPRPTVRIGRQAMVYGGGDDLQSAEDDGSLCANQSDCVSHDGSNHVAEESRERSVVLHETMCDSDDGLVNGAWPRRGEM
jgi:hypothetical protein